MAADEKAKKAAEGQTAQEGAGAPYSLRKEELDKMSLLKEGRNANRQGEDYKRSLGGEGGLPHGTHA